MFFSSLIMWDVKVICESDPFKGHSIRCNVAVIILVLIQFIRKSSLIHFPKLCVLILFTKLCIHIIFTKLCILILFTKLCILIRFTKLCIRRDTDFLFHKMFWKFHGMCFVPVGYFLPILFLFCIQCGISGVLA